MSPINGQKCIVKVRDIFHPLVEYRDDATGFSNFIHMQDAFRVLSSAIVLLSCSSSAFFLSWGGQDNPPPTQPHYYYHQRVLQAPSAYGVPLGTEPPTQQPYPGTAGVPVPLPSIPIQVPLQAQLSPSASVHNVQLVPCLCPVSQEFEYEKVPQDSNVLYSANQQHKNNQ